MINPLKYFFLLLLTVGVVYGHDCTSAPNSTCHSDGTEADLQNAINAAGDGSTILLPSTPTPIDWTVGGINIPATKALTIQGTTTIANNASGPPPQYPQVANDTTADPASSNSIPGTVIRDRIPTANRFGGTLISCGSSTGKKQDITGITFSIGPESPPLGAAHNGVIVVSGVGDAVRIHHCHFVRLQNDTNIRVVGGSICVIDHNRFYITANHQTLQAYNGRTWPSNSSGLSDVNGNNSWNDGPHWGTNQFIYLEDNTIFSTIKGDSAGTTDCTWGGRYVARYNYAQNNYWATHGTEGADTKGGTRGSRAIEIYNNHNHRTFDMAAGLLRSGNAMIHDNQWTGNTPSAFTTIGATIERGYVPFSPWGGADGANAWDLNPAGQPILASGTFTTGSAGQKFFDTSAGGIASASSAGQWVGAELRYGPTYQYIGYITASTINPASVTIFLAGDNGYPFPFQVGWLYRIRRLTRALDQTGTGNGTLIIHNSSGAPVLSTTNAPGWPNPVAEASYSWNNKFRFNGWNGSSSVNDHDMLMNRTLNSTIIGPGGANADFFNAQPTGSVYPGEFTHPHPRTTGGAISFSAPSASNNAVTLVSGTTANCSASPPVNCFNILTNNNDTGTILKASGPALPTHVALDSTKGDGTATLSGDAVGATPGTYTMTFSTNAGAVVSVPFTLTVSATQAKPSCLLDAPKAGDSFTVGDTINMAATANSSGLGSIKNVKFYDGATLLSTDTSVAYSYPYPSVSGVGSHILKAVATDNLDQVSDDSTVTVSVSSATPTPTPTATATPPTILVK